MLPPTVTPNLRATPPASPGRSVFLAAPHRAPEQEATSPHGAQGQEVGSRGGAHDPLPRFGEASASVMPASATDSRSAATRPNRRSTKRCSNALCRSSLPILAASRPIPSRRHAVGFRRTCSARRFYVPSRSWLVCIPHADDRNNHGRRSPCDDGGTHVRDDPEGHRRAVDTDTPHDVGSVERSFPARCLAGAPRPSGRFVPRSVDPPIFYSTV